MIRNDWQDFVNELSKLIARAWLDNHFRENFIADPRTYILDAGLTLPDELEVQVDQYSYHWKIEPCYNFERLLFTIGLPPKPFDLIEDRLNTEEILRSIESEGIFNISDEYGDSFWSIPCCGG